MKVKIVENSNLDEDIVTIECKKITDDVKSICEYIENYGLNIIGKLDGSKYFLSLNDIFYFEAVDNHVFAYTKDLVYEITYKINELNELLSKSSFMQISRTIILNIDKIKKVSTLINGRILAVLENGEKQIITRAYAYNFRQKLKKKGDNL